MEAHRRYINTLIQVKTTFYLKNCKVFNMTIVMTGIKEKRKRERSEMKQGHASFLLLRFYCVASPVLDTNTDGMGHSLHLRNLIVYPKRWINTEVQHRYDNISAFTGR